MKFDSYLFGGSSPLDHLAAEACLLSAPPSDQCILVFYINCASVIIGRNQNPWKEISPSSTLPFFRRASGGGAVYHDEGNLNWALIVPRRDHDKDAELALVAAAISSLGKEVLPGPRGGLYISEGDAGLGGKVGGTARRFGPKMVLHHGTLLISADLSALASSLGGLETLDDASLPSVPAKAVNLRGEGLDLNPLEVATALSRFIAGRPPLAIFPDSLDQVAFERERALLGSDDWRFGITPPFAIGLGGAGDLKLIVEKGRAVRFMGATSHSQEELSRFLGLPFSSGLLEELSKYVQREPQQCRSERSMS
jgi:lipoate-protein ligase A